jgi:hypothetical protein
MNEQPSSRGDGAIRVHFEFVAPFSPEEGRLLVGEIAGELPVAPEEVEVDPAGSGSVLYVEHDELTLDELTAAVLWLRQHPRIRTVWWETVVDV